MRTCMPFDAQEVSKMKHYVMPAEWEPHERTWIAWPVRGSMVHPEEHDAVCGGYAAVIRSILAFEPVTVLVDEDFDEEARKWCCRGADFLHVPHDDAWMRDAGPTFVFDQEGRRCGVDWRFNAWGGKYSPCDRDDAIASAVLKACAIPPLHSGIVLEGGSIHVDGEGTMITTEECLLNPNRNPSLTRAEIERELSVKLGIERFLWLPRGLSGDETDGHVDNIACFSAPGVVLLQSCDDPCDPNHAVTQEALAVLEDAVDARGRKIRVVEIPQPPARMRDGERLTLSYLNFYLVNGGVILPVFGDDAEETDRQALQILEREFPDRRVVPVDGMALIAEGGNVHCITQQMPAAR